MAMGTGIQWADDTVNFWAGCTKVSPGCDNCYAATLNKRFRWVPEWDAPPRWVESAPVTLKAINRRAIRTGQTRFVFINSISDFFDNQAPDEWRRIALDQIEQSYGIIALLVTKRPQNIARQLDAIGRRLLPRNVWLGITAENQLELQRRVIPWAQQVVTKRFLSLEPLLGQIDLEAVFVGDRSLPAEKTVSPENWFYPLESCVHWVIAGGESGANARPWHPSWARRIRDQCVAAGVPFFWKQNGAWSPERPPLYHMVAKNRASHECMTFQPDGTKYNALEPSGWNEPGMTTVFRHGVRGSGRLLDGVEWNERPSP